MFRRFRGARLGCCIIGDGSTTPITAAPATTTTTAAPTTTTTTAAPTTTPPPASTATCVLQGNATGTLTLMQAGSALTVSGTVSGLVDGKHGFHIHTWGDLGNNCVAAGPHYNP